MEGFIPPFMGFDAHFQGVSPLFLGGGGVHPVLGWFTLILWGFMELLRGFHLSFVVVHPILRGFISF